jgi:hypothetical protein
MNENIIAWNVTNWVTVIIMAAVGFFIIGAGLKWRQSRASKSVTVNTTTAAGAQSLA